MISIEILKEAKALISDPKHWCQHAYCRNKDGRQITIDDMIASDDADLSFCALGAFTKASTSLALRLGNPDATEAWKAMVEATPNKHISDYNDAPERTHEEIMTMFDTAIALLEKEEGT